MWVKSNRTEENTGEEVNIWKGKYLGNDLPSLFSPSN